jgi:glycosyltransferase involved in cell wall biosynthesis
MKLLYIANSYIPSKAANSIHVMKMCYAFSQLGHEVTLLTFSSPENEEAEVDDVYQYYGVGKTFTISKIPRRKLKGKMHAFAFEALQFAKKLKPDLVYTRCHIPAVYLSFSSLPFVLESHRPFVDKGGFLGYLFKRIFRSSNLKRLVVISQALKEIFSQLLEQDIEILALHDAADIPEKLNGVELNWQGRDNTLQVGYFGHLYPGRGVDVIIELAKLNLQTDFHIIGGRLQDIRHWQEQVKNVSNLYFYGFVSPSTVALYREKCDVLVAPYQKQVWVENKSHESSKFMSPLKVFEYMSSAKCIICSDIPVLREVLNEDNSILVAPDDATEWNKALSLCNDEELRSRLASKAYQDFINNYTWKKRAELSIKDIVSEK